MGSLIDGLVEVHLFGGRSKQEVLGKVVVSGVAVLVLASCGMHSPGTDSACSDHPFPSVLPLSLN